MADPRHSEFLDPQVLARLAAIPLHARLPMVGGVSGRHQSPHRGSSVEFAEYRKYVPGDDPRRLDWRAYARSDRYYIKEFEADTNLRAYLVVDTSASMGFKSGALSKLDFARKIAATVAHLTILGGDAVGLTCCSETISTDIPPMRKPSHLQALNNALFDCRATGGTGLVGALHAVAEKVRQRALVIILSDLFIEPDDFNDALRHLRFNKHDVAVFHLFDRQEIEFRFDRPLRFVDLEDGTAIPLEPRLIAERYHDSLREYLAVMRRYCHACNADYHMVTTDSDYGDLLADFLTARIPKKRRN
jgi:uncharacterized protein (DUF58 family)